MQHEYKNSTYDILANDYDVLFNTDNPYYEPFNECEAGVFKQYVPVAKEDQRAIDLGCGTGFHTSWLIGGGYRTVGVDVSSGMIDVARRRCPGAYFIEGSLEEVAELGGAEFDVVTCLGSSLNHFSDWGGVARVVGQRLKKRGVFVYSYDNVDGVDVVARTLLRTFDGYSARYIRDVLFGRARARVNGLAYRNHWTVRGNAGVASVPLTYESNARWRRQLEGAGLRVMGTRGVHLFDCFDRNVLRASAGMVGRAKNTSGWCRLLRKLDQVVAGRLPWVSAGIVGAAIKD